MKQIGFAGKLRAQVCLSLHKIMVPFVYKAPGPQMDPLFLFTELHHLNHRWKPLNSFFTPHALLLSSLSDPWLLLGCFSRTHFFLQYLLVYQWDIKVFHLLSFFLMWWLIWMNSSLHSSESSTSLLEFQFNESSVFGLTYLGSDYQIYSLQYTISVLTKSILFSQIFLYQIKQSTNLPSIYDSEHS